jgi:hypothetical protein
MKFIYAILCACILFVACAPPVDNSAAEAFEKNSQTVVDNLKGFQNENIDYSQYANDFILGGTSFGEKDSISLNEMIEMDKNNWKTFDFKLVTYPLVLLPGVDVDTKKADGSVRHYSLWEVTLPATDSTEAKSGQIKLYESFDFDEDGKIVFQQVYGDFGGIMGYLFSPEE